MSNVTILCDSPRIVALEGFFSQDECDHFVKISQAKKIPSSVVDSSNGREMVNPYRTGTMAVLEPRTDSIVHNAGLKVAHVTNTREEQGEPFQVVGYKRGDQYKPHQDWFDPETAAFSAHAVNGGQRIKTLMVYVKCPKAGGETEFVGLGIKIKPKLGMALMWDNVLMNGKPDPRLLHAARPVISGEKFVATRWIRERAWDRSENGLTARELNEKLCAAAVEQVCKRFDCDILAHPFIYEGRILARARVHMKT